MKFLFIVGLLGFGFQSVGENANLDMLLHPMVYTYATEIAKCEVSELNIDSLSDLKNICKSLIDSGICSEFASEIAPEYRLSCNNFVLDPPSKMMSKIGINFSSEYEREFTGNSAWSSTKACVMGVSQGFIDIYNTSINMGGATMILMHSLNISIPLSREIAGNIKSFWNNLAAEADRLEKEEESVWPFPSALGAYILKYLIDNYKEFGCLNEEGQTAWMCEIGTNIVSIYGGGALTKKGLEKIIKKSKTAIQKKRDKNFKADNEENNSKKSSDEPLSEKEEAKKRAKEEATEEAIEDAADNTILGFLYALFFFLDD